MTDINIIPLEPIAVPGCPTVPPSIPLPIISPIGKPNTITLIKSQQTKNNTSNKNVRNNNVSRNNSKGKGR
ncbi:MAG: hypothetical protein CO128_07940 [Ignavibacteriales bacterium CG_4_9_14_3_um_filter_30_11]|nr:MAG: hypothetical protein CO128_07940 [Ignavibacteriales bacterium CG_4_9_14_3_um_filter_30_11]